MASKSPRTDQIRSLDRTQRSQRITAKRAQIRLRAQLMMNVLLLILVVIAAGGIWFWSVERRYQDRIYPNVTVLGVNVGGLQPEEAVQVLEDHFRGFQETPIVLTFEDRSWSVSGEELGLQMAFEESVQQAYRIGRTRDMFTNMQTILGVIQTGSEVAVTVVVDEQQTQASVARLSAVIDQVATNPELMLNGTAIWVEPASKGRMVLVDETVARIREVLPLLAKQQQVVVATRELLPRVNAEAVEEARKRFYDLVGQPLTVRVGEDEFVWSSADLARMIEHVQVAEADGSDSYQLFFNPYQLERRIVDIAEETQTPPVYPRVAWNGGNLVVTDPGKPGWKLNRHEGRDIITQAVDAGERTVTLTPRYVAVPITQENVNTLGIVGLVSEGKSDFTGSAPYRVTNIEAGLKLLDGILIPPGEEFSFNDSIGEINEENGFVEGYAIVQNRTQLEYGGGICQDSTTVFRAAFWAGLPITERWGHSFYISWYDKYGPTGMDSTIFTGGPDLKFLNDTGNWLLMQTSANPKTGVASVRLYGTPTKRKVELVQYIYERTPAPETPVYVADAEQPQGTIKHSDRARDGLAIEIERYITDPDGTVRQPDSFLTRFKPWPNIFVLNPQDMAGGVPIIEMPASLPNLGTPSLTPDDGVRYITPEKTAPVAEAPQPGEVNN